MTALASDNPQILHASTIGEAWLAAARHILADGIVSRYDDLPVREISLVTLVAERPDPADEIIARHADPGRLAWMHANFTDHSRVTALGGPPAPPTEAAQGAQLHDRDRYTGILPGISVTIMKARRRASGAPARPGPGPRDVSVSRPAHRLAPALPPRPARHPAAGPPAAAPAAASAPHSPAAAPPPPAPAAARTRSGH